MFFFILLIYDFFFNYVIILRYTYIQDTDFHDVKVLVAMKSASRDFIYYITFMAFCPRGLAVTFQTKICDFLPRPFPKFEIMYVRIKTSESDQKKSKYSEGQPSEFDHKGKFYEQRRSQVIKTYTSVCFLVPFSYGFTNLCTCVDVNDSFKLNV